MTEISYPTSSTMPTSHLPFSPAVRYGDLLFVSGQASVDKTGKIISGTFEEEFRRSLENLIQILEDSGSGIDLVIQTRNYVRDPEFLPLYQKLYVEYFKAPFPARTTITHCLTTKLHYEIECVAVCRTPSPST